MAYTINLTDGTVFATVGNGTIDDTSSSLVLVGKNYAGYGEFVAENFVRLLESGANATEPTVPLRGQLWYDTSLGNLRVYTGESFKSLANAAAQESEPELNVLGDMWFDTINSQLNVYDGSQYVLIGPAFTSGTGTSGSIVDTVTDTIAVDHVVVKLYVDDEIVAIVSKDAVFTPALPITGFAATIGPGIQLADTITGQVPEFIGTATNAELLNSIPSSGFLSSTADDTTTGSLSIVNDLGLTAGASGDAKLTVSGNDVVLSNVTAGGDMLLQVNSGGGAIPIITLDATVDRATVSLPTAATDQIASANYVDDTTVSITGDRMTGGLIMQADLTIDTGSQIIIDEGTAANPSIVFSETGADTGIYSQADNYINFATVGTDKVKIEPNGTISVNAALNYETLVTDDDDIPNKKYMDDTITAIFEAMYPVGAVYIGADPNAIPLIPGTWVQVAAGTFLQALGNGSEGALGTTGGTNAKVLSLAEMPSHNHGGGTHRHYLTEKGAGTARFLNTGSYDNFAIMTNQGGTGNAEYALTASTGAGANAGVGSYSGTIISTQGSNSAFNNRPAYKVVDMWERTA